MSLNSSAHHLMVSYLPSHMHLRLITNAPKRARLPAVVRKLLFALEQQHTLSEACRVVGIPEDAGLAILKKLYAMSLLQPPRPLCFSETEEAFFASDVQPIDECDEPFKGPLQSALELFGGMVARLRGRLA